MIYLPMNEIIFFSRQGFFCHILLGKVSEKVYVSGTLSNRQKHGKEKLKKSHY